MTLENIKTFLLKEVSKHSEVEIAFGDCSRLFSCKNTSGNVDELPIRWFVLDKRTGMPLMLYRRNKETGNMIGVVLSFEELRECARQNSSSRRIEGLTAENWREYTIYRAGDEIPVYGRKNGEGPYHDETRLGLRVDTDGYTVFYQEISPMGGGCTRFSQLPFGYFQNKTLEDVNLLFRVAAIHIPEENIEIGRGDYEKLLETDRYRSGISTQQ